MQADNFPLLVKYYAASNGQAETTAARAIKRLTASISTITAAQQAGSISQTEYKELRGTVSNLLHDAFSQAAGEFTYQGKWENLPKDILDFECAFGFVEVHTFAGKLKKLSGTRLQHPLIDALRGLATEVEPLVTAVVALQDKVSVNTRKPAPEAPTRYVPPAGAPAVVKSLYGILTALCETSRKQMYGLILSDRIAVCERFAAEAAAKSGKYSPADFARAHRTNELHALQRATERNGNRYVLAQNWRAEIEKLTASDVQFMLDQFVFRVMKKLAPIVTAKSDAGVAMNDPEVISRTVQIGSLEGSFRFTFQDGSQFVTQNALVWSTSVNGRPFMRFPLTFHSVKMPGGAKMDRPSEQRMHDVWMAK